MAFSPDFTEANFRKELQATFDQVEAAFEQVDPDLVECDQAFGSLTLRTADGARVILSAQPSVRQLWLALAAKGTAHHFDYDHAGKRWMDDKGKGIELLTFLKAHFLDVAGVRLSF